MEFSSIDEIMDDLNIDDVNDLTNNEEIDNNQTYINKVLIGRYEPSEELMNEIGVVDYFTVDQIEQVVSEEDTMLLISMESKLFPSYEEEDLKEIFLLAFETQNEEIIDMLVKNGATVLYEYRCHYIELSRIQYYITGDIVPQELFKFESTANNLLNIEKLSVLSYIKSVGELDLHRWLKEIPELVFLPNPDTTLAKLSEQETNFKQVLQEISDSEQIFDGSIRFFDFSSNKRETLITHQKQVKDFLKELKVGIGELNRLYHGQPDTRLIGNVRDSLINRLTRLAGELDQTTEKLEQ